VIPAMILHDVGWKEIPENLQLKFFGPNRVSSDSYRKHEAAGAKIARGILEKVDYDGGKIGEVKGLHDRTTIIGPSKKSRPKKSMGDGHSLRSAPCIRVS
jgi:hypothetical protein